MPRKKGPSSESNSPRHSLDCASFRAYVSNKPKAPIVDPELILQPWFLPNEISTAIRSLIPFMHIRKMRFYFEDYGCIRCRRRNVPYGNNGFCHKCSQLVVYRTLRSLKSRLEQIGTGLTTGEIFVDGLTGAQRLIQAANMTDTCDLDAKEEGLSSRGRLYRGSKQGLESLNLTHERSRQQWGAPLDKATRRRASSRD